MAEYAHVDTTRDDDPFPQLEVQLARAETEMILAHHRERLVIAQLRRVEVAHEQGDGQVDALHAALSAAHSDSRELAHRLARTVLERQEATSLAAVFESSLSKAQMELDALKVRCREYWEAAATLQLRVAELTNVVEAMRSSKVWRFASVLRRALGREW
jgi:chromosome segregation ATPase